MLVRVPSAGSNPGAGKVVLAPVRKLTLTRPILSVMVAACAPAANTQHIAHAMWRIVNIAQHLERSPGPISLTRVHEGLSGQISLIRMEGKRPPPQCLARAAGTLPALSQSFAVRPPFPGGHLPHLARQPAANVFALLRTGQPHAVLLRDAARGAVGRCLGHTHGREPKRLEPVLVDCFGRLRHQALTLPFRREPKAAVVSLSFDEPDAADDLLWRRLQTDTPVPLLTPLHRGQCLIAKIRKCAIRRIRPGNARVQMLHDLPPREDPL